MISKTTIASGEHSKKSLVKSKRVHPLARVSPIHIPIWEHHTIIESAKQHERCGIKPRTVFLSGSKSRRNATDMARKIKRGATTKPSCNYIVDRTGECIRTVRPSRIGDLGDGAVIEGEPVHRELITIMLMNRGDMRIEEAFRYYAHNRACQAIPMNPKYLTIRHWETYLDFQIASLVWLIANLKHEFPTIDRIVGAESCIAVQHRNHRFVDVGVGPLFPWKHIRSDLEGMGIKWIEYDYWNKYWNHNPVARDIPVLERARISPAEKRLLEARSQAAETEKR